MSHDWLMSIEDPLVRPGASSAADWSSKVARDTPFKRNDDVEEHPRMTSVHYGALHTSTSPTITTSCLLVCLTLQGFIISRRLGNGL